MTTTSRNEMDYDFENYHEMSGVIVGLMWAFLIEGIIVAVVGAIWALA